MAAAQKRPRLMVDLDPVDKKRLQALADTAERTLSAEARLAIRDWIDKQTRGKR